LAAADAESVESAGTAAESAALWAFMEAESAGVRTAAFFIDGLAFNAGAFAARINGPAATAPERWKAAARSVENSPAARQIRLPTAGRMPCLGGKSLYFILIFEPGGFFV
jgi:hypothetical protein